MVTSTSIDPDPFNARGGRELAWWVIYDGLICVGLRIALILVIKRLGGEGTSNKLW